MVPELCVHAPLLSKSIASLALTHLPLPPGLSNSAAHSDICLTLAVWMIHGLMGFHSLHPISSLDWAVLGYKLSPFYLAHLPFCPTSVGWLVLMSCHCTASTMISLILLPVVTSRLMGRSLCHVNFLYYSFFWTLLPNILARLAHYVPWASLAHFIP